MNIKLRHPRIVIPSSTSLQIREALDRVLDRFSHKIKEVNITFRDINGPKGGIDKECKVYLALSSSGAAIASGSGVSFLEAAHEACNKLKEIVRRKLKRKM